MPRRMSVLALVTALLGFLPPAPARTAPELWRQVEIIRTEHGVPDIRAQNLRAAGYALDRDPKSPDRYLFDGASLPIARESRTVTFRDSTARPIDRRPTASPRVTRALRHLASTVPATRR